MFKMFLVSLFIGCSSLLLVPTMASAMPCFIVNSAVSHYTAPKVWSWAKAHGYSPKQIKEAQTCIKPSVSPSKKVPAKVPSPTKKPAVTRQAA